MTRAFVTGLALTAAMATAVPALAQRVTVGGDISLHTGLEGGDPGLGKMIFRRARTRLAVGIDFQLDEDPNGVFGVRPFAELEPSASFGTELRYGRSLGKWLMPFAGVSTILAPHTLFGFVAGLQVRVPMGQSAFFIEPSFSAMPFGTDLPGERVLIWGLVGVGFRTNLFSPPVGE